MTDRTPDDPGTDADEIDETVDLVALHDMGFDILAADAPIEGLDDVRARSTRATRRRRWALGTAAAAVVLVVGSLGVLLARTGEESAPDVATQPTTVGEQFSFLLPPADASEVGFGVSGYDPTRMDLDSVDPDHVPFYILTYRVGGGPERSLGVDVNPAASAETLQVMGFPGERADSFAVRRIDPFGEVRFTCDPDLVGRSGSTMGAFGHFGGGLRFGMGPGTGQPTIEGCSNEMAAESLAPAVQSLRVVGFAEWLGYLREHQETNTLDPVNASTTTTP